jgi:hypothetical protein
MNRVFLVEMDQHARTIECTGSLGKIAHTLKVFGITAPHFVLDTVSRLIPRYLRLDPMLKDVNIRSYEDNLGLAEISTQLSNDIEAVTIAVKNCRMRCDDYTQCQIYDRIKK